jgi:signal transduction histidine kinase
MRNACLMSDQPFLKLPLRSLRLKQSLALTLVLTAAGLTAMEITKQLLAPEISIWESHVVTIIFGSAIATLAAFFVLRRQDKLQCQLAEHEQQAAILAERTRVARDIHDTLSQSFTGIVIQLENVVDLLEEDPRNQDALRQHITRARALAQDGLAEARRSVWELRPVLLEHKDLATALEQMVEQLTNGTVAHAHFSCHGAPQALPSTVEEHLFRIGQEALSNVLRHAHARTIHMTLSFEAQHVTLEVTDDGQGFDPHQDEHSRFGLLSMKERAERMGGHLTIHSQAEQGTTLKVVAPIRFVPYSPS